jgi:hypothetical protein
MFNSVQSLRWDAFLLLKAVRRTFIRELGSFFLYRYALKCVPLPRFEKDDFLQ